MKALLKFFAQNPQIKAQEKQAFRELFDAHTKALSSQDMLTKLKEGASKYDQRLLSEIHEPELLRNLRARETAVRAADQIDRKKTRELIELILRKDL